MLSQYSFDKPNGSIIRAKWEYDALKKNGFTNISIIDNFSKSSKIPSNCLFHAHQTSGQFLEKKSYISDLHGIGSEEMWHKSFSKSLPYWKKIGFRTKSYLIKKLEKKLWANSLHLVCAGEMIYDKVKSIQSATIVRNAININDYPITQHDDLRVAIVGPFLPGTQNYDELELYHFCVKNLPNINFDFIGNVSDDFKNLLPFSNVRFLGRVENYIDALSNCNILLSPYPEHSYLLAAPTKMLEAGACQIPIVTTQSGISGFSKDLVLIGKSKHDFVDKLLYLKDENIRKTFGKKLRQEIEINHNADIEIKKLISLYNELM
jgi:glycosyltransferase involved in cell wall biosynthesis